MIRKLLPFALCGVLAAHPALAGGRLMRGVGASGGAQAAFTFNNARGAALTDTGISLSGDLRDITGATAGEVGARALLPQTSAKVCVEYKVTAATPATSYVAVGLADTSYTSSAFLGGSANSAMGLVGDTTYATGVTRANTAAWTPGGPSGALTNDIITVCADFTAGKAFVALNNVFGASQDPAAGTSPWLTWTPGGTWNFASASKAGKTAGGVSLSATATYTAPSGFTTLNH